MQHASMIEHSNKKNIYIYIYMYSSPPPMIHTFGLGKAVDAGLLGGGGTPNSRFPE